jgi:hypothetical protein
VGELGSLEEEPLGLDERLRSAALDQVREERERRAAEADQGHAVGQRATDRADGLEDERDVRFGLEDAQGVDAALVTDRLGQARAGVADRDLGPHAGDGDEDVAEQDGRVDAEPLDRLQRDLGGEVRPAAQLHEPDPGPHRLVLGHVAARLAHDPDGRRVDRLSPASPQEPIGARHPARVPDLAARRLHPLGGVPCAAACSPWPNASPVGARGPPLRVAPRGACSGVRSFLQSSTA